MRVYKDSTALIEQLRLAQVKRYPINHTNRDQSVAEHTFGVVLIAIDILAALPEAKMKELSGDLIMYALFHDMNEIYTGDIPSGFKRRLKAEYSDIGEKLDGMYVIQNEEVKGIVKLADYLESIYFLKEFGASRFGVRVLDDVIIKFNGELIVSKAPPEAIDRAKEIFSWI